MTDREELEQRIERLENQVSALTHLIAQINDNHCQSLASWQGAERDRCHRIATTLRTITFRSTPQ